MWPYILSLTVALAGVLAYIRLDYVPAALFLPVAYFALRTYLDNRKKAEIDSEVPRALLELSSSSVRTYRDVLDVLSSGFGRLSEEVRRVQAMKTPDERKMAILGNVGGNIARRAFRTIITGMSGGADTRELFRRVGEDLESQMGIERSKQSSLALQRYSIMLTAGVFVPAVLGLTAKLVSELAATHLFTGSAAANLVLQLMPVHISVVCVEASLYLALVDGRAQHVAIYATLLIPLALSIFWALGMG